MKKPFYFSMLLACGSAVFGTPPKYEADAVPSHNDAPSSLDSSHPFARAMHEAFPFEIRNKAAHNHFPLRLLPFPLKDNSTLPHFDLTAKTIQAALMKIFNGGLELFPSSEDSPEKSPMWIILGIAQNYLPYPVKESFQALKAYLASLPEKIFTKEEQERFIAFFKDSERQPIVAAYAYAIGQDLTMDSILPEYQERPARLARLLHIFKQGSTKTDLEIMVDLFTSFISMYKASVIFGALAEEPPSVIQSMKDQIERIRTQNFNEEDIPFLEKVFFPLGQRDPDFDLVEDALNLCQPEGEALVQKITEKILRHLSPMTSYVWHRLYKGGDDHLYIRNNTAGGSKPFHHATLDQVVPLLKKLIREPSFQNLIKQIKGKDLFCLETSLESLSLNDAPLRIHPLLPEDQKVSSETLIDQNTYFLVKDMKESFSIGSVYSSSFFLKNPSAQSLFFFPLGKDGTPRINSHSLLNALKRVFTSKISKKKNDPKWRGLLRKVFVRTSPTQLDDFLTYVLETTPPSEDLKRKIEDHLPSLLEILKTLNSSSESLEKLGHFEDKADLFIYYYAMSLMSPAQRPFTFQERDLQLIDQIKTELEAASSGYSDDTLDSTIIITCAENALLKDDKSYGPLWDSLIEETLTSKEAARLEKFFKDDPERQILPLIFAKEKPEFFERYKGNLEKRLRRLLGVLKPLDHNSPSLERTSDFALMYRIFNAYCTMSAAGEAFGLQEESLEKIKNIKDQILRTHPLKKLKEEEVDLLKTVFAEGKLYIEALVSDKSSNEEFYRQGMIRTFLSALTRSHQPPLPSLELYYRPDAHKLECVYEVHKGRVKACKRAKPFSQKTRRRLIPLLEETVKRPTFQACGKGVVTKGLFQAQDFMEE